MVKFADLVSGQSGQFRRSQNWSRFGFSRGLEIDQNLDFREVSIFGFLVMLSAVNFPDFERSQFLDFSRF